MIELMTTDNRLIIINYDYIVSLSKGDDTWTLTVDSKYDGNNEFYHLSHEQGDALRLILKEKGHIV